MQLQVAAAAAAAAADFASADKLLDCISARATATQLELCRRRTVARGRRLMSVRQASRARAANYSTAPVGRNETSRPNVARRSLGAREIACSLARRRGGKVASN